VKKLFLALCLLVIGSNISVAGNIRDLDKKNGFKNYICDSPISKYPDLVFDSNADGPLPEKIYESTAVTAIGNYPIYKVLVVFYKNKLHSIQIVAKEEINSRGILEIFKSAYGKPQQDNQFLEKYYWNGKKVIAEYDENMFSHDSVMRIFCKKTLAEYDRDEKNLQNKAKSEL
jgi:hypothetical protein